MAARTKELAVALAVLIGCGASLYGSPRGPQGSAPQPRTDGARRVVSLVPAVTEILFAIGAGPQVVAVSSYDDFPPDVKSLPRVGALLDPDVERILALRPDLVIAYGSQTDLQGQLDRAHVPVFSYRHAGLAGMFQTIRAVGTATGRQGEAERLARSLQAQLDAVRARVQGRRRPRTLLVFERDPMTLRGLYVSGGRGFLHEMLEIAGGENVFADVQREAVQPSHETLLTRGGLGIEVRATRMSPRAAGTKSGRRGRRSDHYRRRTGRVTS